MHKYFVGLNVNDQLSSQLLNVKKENTQLEAIRWTKPAYFHITFQYLGYQSNTDIERIKNDLQTLTQSLTSFELQPKELSFSPGKDPKGIWLYFKKNAAFKHLCNSIAKQTNVAMPARFFPVPHIQLAGLKKNYRYYKPVFSSVDELAKLSVSEFNLYRSTTSGFELDEKFVFNK